MADRFLGQSQNSDYGAAVECIDWATGVLIDELERQRLDENTLIIFTTDNGCRGDYGGSNASLRGGKLTTWEGYEGVLHNVLGRDDTKG